MFESVSCPTIYYDATLWCLLWSGLFVSWQRQPSLPPPPSYYSATTWDAIFRLFKNLRLRQPKVCKSTFLETFSVKTNKQFRQKVYISTSKFLINSRFNSNFNILEKTSVFQNLIYTSSFLFSPEYEDDWEDIFWSSDPGRSTKGTVTRGGMTRKLPSPPPLPLRPVQLVPCW